MKRLLFFALSSLLLLAALGAYKLHGKESASSILKRVQLTLSQALAQQNLSYGAPVFIRIFKQPAMLEVWVEGADKRFKKFKSYPICAFSGKLGPKLKEGDHQAPEGFYFVPASQLNPNSSFHLSFNLGFPNAYDRAQQRTGSFLMVHGDCVSVGCYAMTDPAIEEIYSLVKAALDKGQGFVRVHIFPFPMTAENLKEHADSEWLTFWQNLKIGYDWFEQHHRPPNVSVKQKRYVFSVAD